MEHLQQTEEQAHINDLSHTEIYAANTMANHDPDIIPYFDSPAPCVFEKITGATKSERVVSSPLALRQLESNNMGKNRPEAFSGGVIAILITIMVLKVPNGQRSTR